MRALPTKKIKKGSYHREKQYYRSNSADRVIASWRSYYTIVGRRRRSGAAVSAKALTRELASELHRQALNVRVYAFFTRFKLNLWLSFRLETARLLPAPHVADFRECAGIRGLHAYDNLKTAAGSLFAHFGHPEFEHLMQSL